MSTESETPRGGGLPPGWGVAWDHEEYPADADPPADAWWYAATPTGDHLDGTFDTREEAVAHAWLGFGITRAEWARLQRCSDRCAEADAITPENADRATFIGVALKLAGDRFEAAQERDQAASNAAEATRANNELGTENAELKTKLTEAEGANEALRDGATVLSSGMDEQRTRADEAEAAFIGKHRDGWAGGLAAGWMRRAMEAEAALTRVHKWAADKNAQRLMFEEDYGKQHSDEIAHDWTHGHEAAAKAILALLEGEAT